MKNAIKLFVVVVLILGGLIAYIYFQYDSFSQGSPFHKLGKSLHPAEVVPVARKPLDYHTLEQRGGLTPTEISEVGEQSDTYAYLRAWEPILMERGVKMAEPFVVHGKQYYMGYIYTTRVPKTQALEFSLAGEWDELHFGFGFADDHPSALDDDKEIRLEVLVDGEVAYPAHSEEPHVFTPNSKPLFTKVSVSGAQRVALRCYREGTLNKLSPVLIDPFVTKSGNPESP